MAPSANIETTLLPSSPLPKKRKIALIDSDGSKKRRKHDKTINGVGVEAELATKKDKKKKTRDILGADAPSSQQPPATEDVELPDIPVEKSSPLAEIEPNGSFENDENPFPAVIEEIDGTLLLSKDPSCFYEKRLSLQLPIPAISLTSSTSSLLSLYLAPILLTYFPPAEGIVLSFSDPVLSAQPDHGVNLPTKPPKSGEIPRNPTDETLARCADAFGVCWVWLTVTFMVFKPESGDELKGWTNVTSEGFVGLVSYNYFQAAVGKTRIPKTWTWDGPSKEIIRNRKRSRKGKLQGEDGVTTGQEEAESSQKTVQEDQTTSAESGSFVDSDGNKVSATQAFKVVDVEMVPGHERDRWTLQIEGSLLPRDEEAAVVAEERKRFEQVSSRSRSRSRTPGPESEGMPLMSGALSFSRDVSPG